MITVVLILVCLSVLIFIKRQEIYKYMLFFNCEDFKCQYVSFKETPDRIYRLHQTYSKFFGEEIVGVLVSYNEDIKKRFYRYGTIKKCSNNWYFMKIADRAQYFRVLKENVDFEWVYDKTNNKFFAMPTQNNDSLEPSTKIDRELFIEQLKTIERM